MSYTFYEAAIPQLVRMLGNLSAVLDKAAAHAKAKNIDPKALLDARLVPDMYPFSRQVQMATDSAKGAAARLGGIDIPSFPDTEASFDELKTRIAKTIEFINSIPAEKFAGAEDRTVELKTPNRTLTFTGRAYLSGFVQPNFFFHATTAYALLRHNGVEIGKMDFLGAV
ncbi:MAG TPA: DUF1993 domain-containing protein [Rhizomicrobium sp.]|nr:DUF1993 domain-containing protein [Rhizomicrobium sp.]